jgi:hypothetical protein
MTCRRATIGVLVLSIVAGCRGPGSGPGMRYSPKDRLTLAVLVPDSSGSGCAAIKLDEHRAFRKDKVIWRIYDACGANGKEIKILFSNDSPADPGIDPVLSATIRTTSGNKWTELRLTVKQLKDLPDDGSVKSFPYDFYLQGNKLADPKLEIDPYI